jgi:hypothetical protein
MEYPASLCSMREYDFLCVWWCSNILQAFVSWENMIFYACYDQGIFCKSLFHERIWFFMHIMTKEYPASLCSMREYDFWCVWWCSNILQVFVPWENMIFYPCYDQGIFCKSLFKDKTWFFMHIMVKEYSTSLCSMENMIFYAYYDHEISCKFFFNERIRFFMHTRIMDYPASLCSMREYDFSLILWSRNILQVFVQWENMIFYAYYD